MTRALSLDAVDRKILELLQCDAALQLADIAERVGLSTSPCWRRIQRLRETGVIRRQVALLDPSSVNVGVTVFVAVRTRSHSAQWFDGFRATVDAIPEVVEMYRMSGDTDYLLRVVVPDVRTYDGVYRRLIQGHDLLDVTSSFAMEQTKYTTALPLHHCA